jgi:D-alanine transaminase
MFFGDGVYEVLRSYQGCIFALDEHMDRFANSLRAVAIEGIQIDTVRQRVLDAFAAASLPNAKIYFHVTRGSALRDLAAHVPGGPNFFLTVTELVEDPVEKTRGIHVATQPDWRWKRCDIKSLNLLANVLARRAAEDLGCQEAILVDEQGCVTEGAASAFFAVRSDPGTVAGQSPVPAVLQTAPLTANILPSVTRHYVLQAAAQIGLAVREESLTPELARGAEELFIAVTTRDLVPVVRFDQTEIGTGKPGPWVKRLQQAFDGFTSV